MIEWVKLSSLIIDQIFNYGPKINNIFKSKEKKHKQFQLKILCNDIANQLQKDLLGDLKSTMDYSMNVPLKKEDLDEINKMIKNVIDIESNKIQIKMKDLIISQFNDILMDNLICTPKYHNLVIVGSNQIYKVINKFYNDDLTIKDNFEKFQLFCTKKAEFRAGLLLYALNISDKLDLFETKKPLDLNTNEENLDNKDICLNNKDNKDILINMKKISNEILLFIKNQNKEIKSDIRRKISGIIICIDNKNQYEQIKELINFLSFYINKNQLQLDLYLININKCIDNEMQNNIITNINNRNEFENQNINNNLDNKDSNNIINIKDNKLIINDFKCFPITINDGSFEILDDEDENNQIDKFLNDLVNKYIEDYMKNNIDNIYCSLNLQFTENLNFYSNKLENEFNKAVSQMKNYNLKNLPLKVEFESQIKKIYSDIFINHIFPLSIKPEINNAAKSKLSNESLIEINDFFNNNLNKVKEITNKGKDEYAMRLISKVKEKINELFTQLEVDKGEKENIEEYNQLKKNFIDDITKLLNEKINFGSDIYDLCLSYFYINKYLFKALSEKILEFCEKNIFQKNEFKEEINKRIIQQIDSYQRRALNID